MKYLLMVAKRVFGWWEYWNEELGALSRRWVVA